MYYAGVNLTTPPHGEHCTTTLQILPLTHSSQSWAEAEDVLHWPWPYSWLLGGHSFASLFMTPNGCFKCGNTLVTRPGAPVDCLVPGPVHPDVRLPAAGSHPVHHLIRLSSLAYSLLTVGQKSLSEIGIRKKTGLTRKTWYGTEASGSIDTSPRNWCWPKIEKTTGGQSTKKVGQNLLKNTLISIFPCSLFFAFFYLAMVLIWPPFMRKFSPRVGWQVLPEIGHPPGNAQVH